MGRHAFLASLLVVSGALVACENGGGTTGTDAGVAPGTDAYVAPGTDAGGPAVDAGPLPGSYALTFGPVRDVAPGVENTQCVILRLGNPVPLRVGSIHNVLGEASHHFIVYRTSATEERTEPFDCTPFLDTLDPTNGSPLMITQRAEETLELPEGVAFTLEANQMIRLELHYVNYTEETRDISATATFIPIPDAEFRDEADFLFIGNPDIDIPPRSMHTLGPTFFELPSEFADASFFAITGHEHQYGTNVVIHSAASASEPGTAVYDVPGWIWSEPETVYYDPPFQVPSGGGFRFTCEWNNTSSSRVGFGESAGDEMCFFWAYYYPSQGARVCVHTDQVGGGLDVCCPGSPLCALVF